MKKILIIAFKSVDSTYSPTKGELERLCFVFSLTYLDAMLVTKTMCIQNLVPYVLYIRRFPNMGGCMVDSDGEVIKLYLWTST